jgi:hypothetical protein
MTDLKADAEEEDHVSFFVLTDNKDSQGDFPWSSSLWLEGDTLAPPCASDLSVIDQMLTLGEISHEDVLLDLGAG